MAVQAQLRGDQKGSVNMRIEPKTRKLIDDAAALLGKSRTEFMVDSARQQAIDVLLDRRLFSLDGSKYSAFVKALENPPPLGPRLRALMQKKPGWKA